MDGIAEDLARLDRVAKGIRDELQDQDVYVLCTVFLPKRLCSWCRGAVAHRLWFVSRCCVPTLRTKQAWWRHVCWWCVHCRLITDLGNHVDEAQGKIDGVMKQVTALLKTKG